MWEGLGSAILGAVAVVIGVWLSQWLNDRSKQKAARQDAEVALGIAIGDQRDAAIKSRGGRRGDYPLWTMRNELFRVRPILGAESGSYRSAAAFYTAVEELRGWTRDQRSNQDPATTHTSDAAFNSYARAVDRYAEEVRAYLGTPEKRRGTPPTPKLPELQ